MIIQTRRHDGFTLIEMAIVIFIASLIYIVMFRAYDYYQTVSRIEGTKSSLSNTNAQISFFFSNTLRYPCPADRTLPLSDPNYGREFDASCNPVAIGLTAPGDCTVGNGICLAAGTRDIDSSSVIGDVATELVLIGAVPIFSILETNDSFVPAESAADGWGSKLTYAVTLSQTNTATYKFFQGVIRAVDEFGNSTAGINNDGHYVLVSHGADQKGAFLEQGGLFNACGATGATVDNENCNDDGIFAQALGHYEANTPSYFDDYVYFSKSQSSGLWSYIPATNHVINLNTNNIGIGTNTPDEKLDVAGTLRVDRNLKTGQICDAAGLCFNIDAITGTGAIACPGGEVMVGISNANEDCAVPAFAAPAANVNCSPGWVHGIRTDGSIICTTP